MKNHLLREKLANLQHQIWTRWMDYQFSQGTFNQNGSWTMHYSHVSHWRRLMKKSYAELNVFEKISDQEIADETLEVLKMNAITTDGKTIIAVPCLKCQTQTACTCEYAEMTTENWQDEKDLANEGLAD